MSTVSVWMTDASNSDAIRYFVKDRAFGGTGGAIWEAYAKGAVLASGDTLRWSSSGGATKIDCVLGIVEIT